MADNVDCNTDHTIASTHEADSLLKSCPTLTGRVDFNITTLNAKLVYAWEQSLEATVTGSNLTFVLGGPSTTELNITRLSILSGVTEFKLGDALKKLTIFDLGFSGVEALDEGQADPCDPIFEEVRGAGAQIEMVGCGMSPNITVDWHDGLEGSASRAMAQLGFAIGLGVVTSFALVF